MSKQTIAFRIESAPGAFVQPHKFVFLKDDPSGSSETHHEPLPYMADLLCALPAFQLFKHMAPQAKRPEFPTWLDGAWEALDANVALFQRAEKRAESFRPSKSFPSEDMKNFCRSFHDILGSCMSSNTFAFENLHSLAESISFLEKKMGEPLMFNFKMKLPAKERNLLFALYSFLYHMRALVALDFNSRVTDTAFECVKVDPLHDYLAKAEYTVNDVLLYKELHKKLTAENRHLIDGAFRQFAHNAFYLAAAMPANFSDKLHRDECEEALYMAQMDWLLGTDSGLLFRLREEVYGLTEGYNKIFWTDYVNSPERKQGNLQIFTHVDEKWLKRALPKSA